MRQFLSRFLKGYKEVSKFLAKVHHTDTVAELRQAIESYEFIPTN